MNIHELEELNWNPQSEAQMCFDEAQQYANAIEPRIIGEGKFEYEVWEPYHCKATDAFVKMVHTATYRFPCILAWRDFVEQEAEAARWEP